MMGRGKPLLLIFLIPGSFSVWLFLRERSLKEECTHFEYDFRFWRNLIVGLIITTTATYYIIELYYYLNPSEMDLMLEEFKRQKDS